MLVGVFLQRAKNGGFSRSAGGFGCGGALGVFFSGLCSLASVVLHMQKVIR